MPCVRVCLSVIVIPTPAVADDVETLFAPDEVDSDTAAAAAYTDTTAISTDNPPPLAAPAALPAALAPALTALMIPDSVVRLVLGWGWEGAGFLARDSSVHADVHVDLHTDIPGCV